MLGFGGGTAFPGLVIEKYYPEYVSELTKHLSPVILVTGTNGKTTTSKIIREIFKASGINLVHNRGGANLFRGIASVLIENEKAIKTKELTGAIFEVEEASLPTVVSYCDPNALVLTNIFRDQLDAYGEVETTAKLIKQGVKKVNNNCIVIYNIDDPRLNNLTQDHTNKIAYSVNYENKQTKIGRDIGDSKRCPNCRNKLEYTSINFSHLGNYRCLNCGFSNTNSDISASNIEVLEHITSFSINGTKFKTKLDGLYSIYNILAAVSTASALGIDISKTTEVINDMKPAFGRGENYNIEKTNVKMILVKNPTGFNSSLDILIDKKATSLILALNDNIADGRDVSWIWDVDFEKLTQVDFENLIVTGKRAEDMKLRLKYAGFDPEKVVLEKDYSKLMKLIEKSEAENFYILPTYTAMLDIRKAIKHSDKEVQDFWK